MSREKECEKKSFTFIWKLENASFSWHKETVYIDSPVFKVEGLKETNWKLRLFNIFGDNQGSIGLLLILNADNKGVVGVQLDYELAFLASDGTVLQSFKEEAKTIRRSARSYGGTWKLASRNEVILKRKSVFLPQDTLTARCRIWKSVGKFSKEVQCFARTRIVVEKRSLLWKIENFSKLESGSIPTYKIKSLDTDEQLMCLELFLTGGQILDETVRLAVIPNYERIKTSSLQLFIVDTSGNFEECSQNEFCYLNPIQRKESDLFFTKRKLMEKKAAYLPNDVLSLKCEFSFSSGVLQQEISNSPIVSPMKKNESDDLCVKEKDLNVHKSILADNLKSMLNNCFSDVKLRAKSQTYPAHKVILSARSPVFKAMFSNDMKEKINECVDIEDSNGDTVLRLLRYIYCAEVEELDWGSATELYELADRYEVLNLKDICSSYLKNNLCISNACEALILADQHQDEDLKSCVQDFILRHGKEIICSEQWDQLAETNIKLAYETTCRKYKE